MLKLCKRKQAEMTRALKFIGGCFLFAAGLVAIAGWMIMLSAMVGR